MNFDICEISEYEKIGYFLKSLKAPCKLIFSKCLVVLGKWDAGRRQFHVSTNITNHFSIIFHFCNSFIYIIKSMVVITMAH